MEKPRIAPLKKQKDTASSSVSDFNALYERYKPNNNPTTMST